MAVMFITHDMGVVAEIADDVVVMRHGKRGRDRRRASSVFARARASLHATAARQRHRSSNPAPRSSRPRREVLARDAPPILDARDVSVVFGTTQRLLP